MPAHRSVARGGPSAPRPVVVGRRLALAALLALGPALGACAGDAAPGATEARGAAERPTEDLSVAVASFDLHVGPDRRLIAAVFTADRALLGGGEVEFELGHLGDEPGGEATVDRRATARWLPVPGSPVTAAGDAPAPLDDPLLAGVYAARVDLDRPGYWGLRVVARTADGALREGRTVLLVNASAEVVDVGDPAPLVANATLEDVRAGRVAPSALDSRLMGRDDPDPAALLHATTVADALAAGRPVVVVIATPVYCQSRVCGPLTETMVDVAARYADRASVVHLEVWEDFDEQRLNDAAAAWIRTERGGNEPWVFLVGADGDVVARWDNVLDLDELERLLAALPVVGPA